MDSVINSSYDDQSENLLLRDGLPTQWQIYRENGAQNFDKQMAPSIQLHKEDFKNTTDWVPDDSQVFQPYEDNPNEDFMDLVEQSEHNFLEVFAVAPIYDQKPSQAKAAEKLPKRKKIGKRKNKKRKSIVLRGRSKYEMSSETKNIPKNYGKQFIKFIKQNPELIKKVLKETGSTYEAEELNTQLQNIKKTVNKIEDLRKLWLDYPFSKEVRVFTNMFLRKYCLSWIFNSRIENIKYPIKYRYRIIEGVHRPAEFLYLKDF